MSAVAYRVYDLPWTRSPEDEQRFRRILRNVMLAILVFGLLLPWLPLPETADDLPPEVPPRYAKLMLKKQPPPPPVPKAEPVVEKVVETAPEPVKEVEPEPVPTPEPVRDPEPARVQQAKETAAKAGVMAFADALADLRENTAVAAVTSNASLSAGAGASTANERSVVTSRSGVGSGGINTASLSRDTGGSGLQARSTTRVASTIGGSGTGTGTDATGAPGSSGAASRSREEIEMVFDKNKGAIFALYKRALRTDPTLQGKLVLSLTIAPNGQVTGCDVVSSELADAEFERKLIARVLLFRFEAKDVATVTTTKPIDFFPA